MAQITWNNVAAPNLGESNSLFAQAIQSLKDAGAGLKDTAKDYQTVVRNKSHAILQDYINSAKTPEELQSEAFNTGFKNLQATLANEYDAVKVNEYRDTRGDVLTRRAGDAVALDLNRLNLTSNTRKENTALGMAELQGLVDNPIAYAAKKAELTQKGIFDGKAEQDFQLGVYNIKNAKRTDDFGNATYAANVENALKAPIATQQTIDASKASVLNQAGMLAVAQKNANTSAMEASARKAEAEARANGGGFTLAQVEEATAKGIANVRKIGGDVLAGVKDKFTFRTMDEVDADVKKTQWIPAWMPNTAKLAKAMIQDTPEIAQLPNPIKAAIYKGLIDRATADNTLGSYDWFNLNRDKYFTAMLASAKEHTGYIEAAKAQEKVAIQDFAVTVNRMSGKASNDAFGFKFANQQLGVSVLDGYGASPDVLDKLNKGTVKQPAASVTVKQNRAPEVQALNEKYLKTKDLGEKLKLMHQMSQMQQQYEAGTQSNLGATPQAASPAITPVAKQVQKTVYAGTPIEKVAQAVATTPTPFVPEASQNAYKNKGNNLSIDPTTGKTTPAKNPVVMPADLDWGTTHQVVRMSPLVAKLPQYKVVATFVPDGDTFSAKSDSYATKGEKAKKAGGILCRVDSVDAPETEKKGYKLGQPYGAEAGKKLQQMILNKEVSIRIVAAANGDPNQVGFYGRDICQIEVEGMNVSTELIRSGAAWLYKEYDNYFTGLANVEADAKKYKEGLWALPNPVYPPTAKHNGSLNLQ